MSDFIKVDSIDSVKISSRWKDSKKFNANGKLVNKNNEYVKISYPGSKYIATWKKERSFTIMERISRFTQIVFYSLLTLGLCNLKKSYRELWTKDKHIQRYAVRFDLPNLPYLQYRNVHSKENKIETKADSKISMPIENETLQESENGNVD